MNTFQMNILNWALRLIVAGIMLQTLYFKFSAAPESVYIFSTLGIEPWGRILMGSLELLASILVLIPRTTSLGALMALGLLSGAIFIHLTKLGIVVQNDGGELFILAIIVWVLSLILLFLFRKQLLSFIPNFK